MLVLVFVVVELVLVLVLVLVMAGAYLLWMAPTCLGPNRSDS